MVNNNIKGRLAGALSHKSTKINVIRRPLFPGPDADYTRSCLLF